MVRMVLLRHALPDHAPLRLQHVDPMHAHGQSLEPVALRNMLGRIHNRQLRHLQRRVVRRRRLRPRPAPLDVNLGFANAHA